MFVNCNRYDFRYKDRHIIPGSDHYQMRYDETNNSHALFISNTLQEDSGYYGCQACNAAGTAFMETQLIVEGIQSSKTSQMI